MSALDEIRGRLEAATPGPWTRNDYVDVDQDGAFDLAHVTAPDPHEPDTAVQGVAMGILRNDAEFIAHAPADVARLLAAVEAINEAVDSAQHDEMCGAYWRSNAPCNCWKSDMEAAITAALEGKA